MAHSADVMRTGTCSFHHRNSIISNYQQLDLLSGSKHQMVPTTGPGAFEDTRRAAVAHSADVMRTGTCVRGKYIVDYLEKGVHVPMAQGRSTEVISMIKWIRTSRL